MSAVPSNIQPAPKANDTTAITIIAGKISAIRPFTKDNGQRIKFVLVAMAAADEFSHPNTVEVNCGAEPIGNVGDVVRLRCKVNGFPRIRKGWTDKTTGEERPGFKTAEISLQLLAVL